MRWTARACYRARQFWGRLLVRAGKVDDGPAVDALSEGAYALFASMPLGDQQHGLCVLETLRRAGEVAPELAQAALLHDVGKLGGGLSLYYRVAIVLMETCCPTILGQLGASPSSGLKRPFYVHLHHAELGAALCEQANCPATMVRLVKHHKGQVPAALDQPTKQMLAALRAADGLC